MAEEETLLLTHPSMFRGRPAAFVLCCILILAAGLGLLILLIWWIRCRCLTLTITTSRTILRQGILSKRTVEVRHNDVRVLEVRQGIIQRMFGTGALSIGSAGHAGVEIDVGGIPSPQKAANLIRQCQGA